MSYYYYTLECITKLCVLEYDYDIITITYYYLTTIIANAPELL